MARRIVPRRLSHDEEATLVEHLTELRQRLLVVLLAIVPAFAVAYVFHEELITRLMDLLPEGTPLVTLGVTEPFTTSLKVSFYVALAIILPLLLWQVWSFFAPAVAADTQRVISVFVVFATFLFAAGVVFCYTIVLPRALEFLVDYDSELYLEQIRASYFLSFVTLTLFAFGLSFQMPIFILGLVRLGALSSSRLRRNRRIGYVAMLSFAILLPTVDPVSLALEVVPLFVLFELSIWLSVWMERRWERAAAEADDEDDDYLSVTIVSADWVVPVEGDPIRDGALAIGDDGRISAVGPASELGAGERFDGCVIVPGLVNCHSHLEYAVYAGFGDGQPFPAWIGLLLRRRALLELDDMRAIAADGAHACLRSGITTIGDCSYAGAAAEAVAETGMRAIVYLEVFGADRSALERFHELHERVGGLASARLTIGISPHAPYTCTLELYRACAELGLPTATHLAESVSERAYLNDGSGDWSAFAELLVEPPGTTGIQLLAGDGLLGPQVMAAHCVDVEPKEIALLADAGVGVAHCPRSNGMLGCGVAPLTDLLDAGIPVGIATDSPASTPSFDLFEELRTAILAARARERRPEALSAEKALELATLGGARVLGLDADVGSLVPGKWADLAVVSLADSPLEPVEDPVTAVVLGGLPDRVAATLVAGETRYRRGTSAWPDTRRAARKARSRMLR